MTNNEPKDKRSVATKLHQGDAAGYIKKLYFRTNPGVPFSDGRNKSLFYYYAAC